MTIRPLSDLPLLLESIKAFYVYKNSGLKKAVLLYPNASVFIQDHALEDYDDVKAEVLLSINKMDTTA